MQDIQKRLWESEIQILDYIDSVCRENNIRYSLTYGSLIGAIRHGGFIPWDDDIDIMMPRCDYNKFIRLVKAEKSNEFCILQPGETVDYTNNFVKIVKNHTAFLQYERDREKKFHKGIFLDVFPVDNVPDNRFLQKIQFVAAAVNLLYARGYVSGTEGVTGFIEAILLRAPHGVQHKLRAFSERVLTAWKSRHTGYCFIACTIAETRILFHSQLFDELEEVPFEKKKYMITKMYDHFLRKQYGDYMKLPPENKRIWTHHPVLIDFEHNYEELEVNE